MKKTTSWIILALLAVPGGVAQWIEDPQGDQEETVAGQPVAHGYGTAADIHSIDVVESEDSLEFHVVHGPLPNPELVLITAVYYQLEFLHGEQSYRINVFYQVAVAGGYYYAYMVDGTSGYLGEVDVEGTSDGFIIQVPKSRIPDHTGQHPTKGTAIMDFKARAENQEFFVSCMGVGDCIRGGLSASDDAPDGDGTARYDFQFGLEQEGDIRLKSPAPVRWSNGEATVFVYELTVVNQGDKTDTVSIRAHGVPDSWQVLDLEPMQLQAGEERAIAYPVKVPFAHAHGEDPRFTLEAVGTGGVGRLKLGVHYPEIPQPTGHHSILHIHTREDIPNVIQQVLFTPFGIGMGADAYMNTATNDEYADGTPVQGSKTNLATYSQDEDFSAETVGSLYEWYIPLSPGLRVGLDVDQNTTEGVVDLAFDVAAGEVRLHGRLALLDEAEQIAFAEGGINPDTSLGQTIATIEGEAIKPIASTVIMPFMITPEPGIIPYEPDQQMFLFLGADVYRPEVPLTPNLGVYLNGGEFVAPLREYHDSVPVNVTFPEEVLEEAALDLDDVASTDVAQESPAVAPVAGLGAIAAAVLVRRRYA